MRCYPLTRLFHSRKAHLTPALINTPLQQGVGDGVEFETVSAVATQWGKPLKRFSPGMAEFTAPKRGANDGADRISGLETQLSGGSRLRPKRRPKRAFPYEMNHAGERLLPDDPHSETNWHCFETPLDAENRQA